MGHYFKQGFSVRQPMWHGLGTVLEDYPGREEAMRIAGHDFEVCETSVGIPVVNPFTGETTYKQAPGWKALTKGENGSILNVVRNSYTVVQNDTLWDIVDAVVGQPNVKYETAGVLKEGAVLWVLAYLDEPIHIKGDTSPILPYICVSTTHDGTGACRAESTDIRVVCWNTFSWSQAAASRRGTTFTFRHSKNVMDRIEDAKMALKGVRVAHEEFVELANELAEITLREQQIESFLANMFPMPSSVDGFMITERVANNIQEARTAVKNILRSETTPEAHRNTGFGVWQAGIEYLDHHRRTKGDAQISKFNRSIMTQPAAKNSLAKMVKEAALV